MNKEIDTNQFAMLKTFAMAGALAVMSIFGAIAAMAAISFFALKSAIVEAIKAGMEQDMFGRWHHKENIGKAD